MAEVSLLRLWRALGLPAIGFGDVHEDDRQACKDLILLADALGGSPQRPIFLQGGVFDCFGSSSSRGRDSGGRNRGGRDSRGNRCR